MDDIFWNPINRYLPTGISNIVVHTETLPLLLKGSMSISTQY